MPKLYISDCHFRHANVLKFDNRPWDNIMEMERDMIQRWNEKVDRSDDVYILGDFCWGTAKDWRMILPQLKGHKHLIKGNHDLKQIPGDIRFASVSEYKEVGDSGYRVCMSHYPMLCYRHDNNPRAIMLYGHVHQTKEAELIDLAVKTFKDNAGDYTYQGRLYNAFCGLYDWAPATLEEIIALHQKKEN